MKTEKEMYLEEQKMYQDAAEARVGSDRMAIELSCLPNEVSGDMDTVKRLNKVIEDKNWEIIRFKEKKIPILENEIERYKELLKKMTNALNKNEDLIRQIKCFALGIEMEKNTIHRDLVPKCEFESDTGIQKCNKPVSRISFGLDCCEEHAKKRDNSLK